MIRDLKIVLSDIIQSIEKIEEYVSAKKKEDFLQDEKTKDAVKQRLQVIGEAVKQVSSSVRKQHPDIEWAKIAGLRDVLIHAYFGVNDERVWVIIQRDLLPLKEKLVKMFKSL